MYFWNDKKLAQDLRQNLVTDRQQMSYLLVTGLFTGILLSSTNNYANFYNAPPLSAYNYMLDTIMIAFIAITIFISYNANARGDNQNFISRYICLSLPIIVKTTLLAIILGMIAGILNIYMFSEIITVDNAAAEAATKRSFSKSDHTGPFSILASIIVKIYTLWRFQTTLKIASGQTEVTA